MSELTREALDRPEIWKRGLFMLLFAVLWGVAKAVMTMVVLVQFVVVLFTGEANEPLLRLGSSLARYAYQIFCYLSFNSEEQPFPMSAWPQDRAEESPWFGRSANDPY